MVLLEFQNDDTDILGVFIILCVVHKTDAPSLLHQVIDALKIFKVRIKTL